MISDDASFVKARLLRESVVRENMEGEAHNGEKVKDSTEAAQTQAWFLRSLLTKTGEKQ